MKRQGPWPLLFFGFFLSVLALQIGAFIASSSATYDEPAVIGAGAAYAYTGRIEIERYVHPPLMKYLFGLAVRSAGASFPGDSPELKNDRYYWFGHEFLFHNKVKPEVLLAFARLPSLLLMLLMGVVVFTWASRWYGEWGGVLALAVYALEPNLVAHGGLANMDAGLTVFLFTAYFFLLLYVEEKKPWALGAAGLLAGCAVGTKFPGLYFFIWSATLLAVFPRGAGAGAKVKGWLSDQGVLLLLTVLVLAALYQFRYAGYYVKLVGDMVRLIFQQQLHEKYFNFLHGNYTVGGWPHYYLVAFLVKVPLPLIALMGLGFLRGTTWREKIVLAIPCATYFLICSAAAKQNGLRYILPVFPFLCVAAGAAVRVSFPWRNIVLGALVAWAAVESAFVAPHYLAYFNQIAGGPRQGYKWLVDSNLDWGQDFPAIRRALHRLGNPEIIVATLGNSERAYYFGPHQDLQPSFIREEAFTHINSSAPAREVLIMSATPLQGWGTTDNPHRFAWLRDKEPVAQPGYSTFVYDISNDAVSHYRMGLIYLELGPLPFARRQFARAIALDPDRPHAYVGLGDVSVLTGDKDAAARLYAKAETLTDPNDAAGRDVVRQRKEALRVP